MKNLKLMNNRTHKHLIIERLDQLIKRLENLKDSNNISTPSVIRSMEMAASELQNLAYQSKSNYVLDASFKSPQKA